MNVLIDISGTLVVGGKPTPGAVEAFKRLHSAQEAGKLRYRCCSNTTKESEDSYVDGLTRAGFPIVKEDIFTSLTSCRSLLERLDCKSPLYLLPDSVIETFPPGSKSDDDVDAIVIGLSPAHFDYATLNKCFRILLSRPDTKVVALHIGRYYKASDGNSLGPGPFVKALEYALTQTKAERTGSNETIIVGKPTRAFFTECVKSMPGIEKVDWESSYMIGDDVISDLGEGAQELGMRRILVRTGKYHANDEDRAESPLYGVYDTFAGAVDMILKDL